MRAALYLILGLLTLSGLDDTSGASAQGTDTPTLDAGLALVCGLEAGTSDVVAVIGPLEQSASNVLTTSEVVSILGAAEVSDSDFISISFQLAQWSQFLIELDETISNVSPLTGDGDMADILLAELVQLRQIVSDTSFLKKLTSVSLIFSTDDLLDNLLLSNSGASIEDSNCDVAGEYGARFPQSVIYRTMRVPGEFDVFYSRVRRAMTASRLLLEECKFSDVVTPGSLVVGNGYLVLPESREDRLQLLRELQQSDPPWVTSITIKDQIINDVSAFWNNTGLISPQWWVAGVTYEMSSCS